MNDIIRALLTKRGLTEMEEIEEFLSPHPRTAYDPRLMYGMQEAVSAVMDAVRSVRDGDVEKAHEIYHLTELIFA